MNKIYYYNIYKLLYAPLLFKSLSSYWSIMKREIYMERKRGRKRSLSGPSPAPLWPDHIAIDDAQHEGPCSTYNLQDWFSPAECY